MNYNFRYLPSYHWFAVVSFRNNLLGTGKWGQRWVSWQFSLFWSCGYYLWCAGPGSWYIGITIIQISKKLFQKWNKYSILYCGVCIRSHEFGHIFNWSQVKLGCIGCITMYFHFTINRGKWVDRFQEQRHWEKKLLIQDTSEYNSQRFRLNITSFSFKIKIEEMWGTSNFIKFRRFFIQSWVFA